MSRPVPAVLAGACCLAWLAVTTGYAAPALAAPGGVDVGGAPLDDGTGSTNPAEPTVLEPGLWSDSLGGSDAQNTHHFTYDRRLRDSTVHVGVVGSPPSTDSDAVRVDVGYVDEDGSFSSCESDDDSITYGIPQSVLGAAVSVGQASADATDRPPCQSSATLRIEVSRGSSSVTAPMPIAIKVVEEARVGDAASLPEPAEAVDYAVPDAGDAEDLPGAASFDDAPELDASADGTTVSTTLAQGEEQLWRVGLDWGQQLVARVTAPAADEADFEGRYSGIPVRVRLVDPRRAVFALKDDDGEGSAEGQYHHDEALDIVAGTNPLRYRNRFDDDLPVVPGDHWVAVSVGPLDESSDLEALDVPVELTVAVTGEPAGAPSYPGVVTSPDEGTQVEGYSPEEPFLVAEETFSAVASGNPIGGDGWFSTRRWAGLGLAAASLACLGAGVVRLRARR
ncbi:hypothetical protein [Nocardioides sp. J54]|uniref:hypothetical protein n=1 Tax=Nocardioides sp. J54 TaxID=935866 RepID=UPI00048E5EE7|nr:hypothetical protein [Nocardioides sp. J54]